MGPSTYPSDTLYSGQVLKMGERIHSENGNALLEMQFDGNCILAAPGSSLVWETDTSRRGTGITATVTSKGQFVIKDSLGEVIWTSRNEPGPEGDYKLVLQNDGNVVMYSRNTGVWHTNTAAKFIKDSGVAEEFVKKGDIENIENGVIN